MVFSFQTLNLLLDWMSGSDEAFGTAPTGFPVSYSIGDIAPYGVVNLVIALVGVGLVVLGARLAARRTARRGTVAVG